MVLIIVRWPFWSFLGSLIFCDANFLGRLRSCLRCRCRCCSCLLSFLVCPSVHLVVASSCLKQSASETFSKTSASCEHERCVCIPLFLSPPFWCRVCCPFWLFASLSPDISTFDLPLSYDTNLEMVVTWLVCGSIVSFVEWVCMYLEDPVLSSLNEEDRLFDGLWRFRSMAWAAEDGSDLFCGFVCSPVFCCGRPCLWKTLSCSSEETDRLLTVSKHRKQKMEVINCFVRLFALVCLYLEDLLLLFTSKEEADRLGGFWSMGSRRWKWFVLWVFLLSCFLLWKTFSCSSARRDRLIDLTVSKLGKQKMEVICALWVCLLSCSLLWKTFSCSSERRDRLAFDRFEALAWEAEDGWMEVICALWVCLFSRFLCVRDLFLFTWKKSQIDLTVSKLGKQKMEVIWIVWVCLFALLFVFAS